MKVDPLPPGKGAQPYTFHRPPRGGGHFDAPAPGGVRERLIPIEHGPRIPPVHGCMIARVIFAAAVIGGLLLFFLINGAGASL